MAGEQVMDRITAETKNSNGAVELRRRTQLKPTTRLKQGHKLNKANLKTKLYGTTGDRTTEIEIFLGFLWTLGNEQI